MINKNRMLFFSLSLLGHILLCLIFLYAIHQSPPIIPKIFTQPLAAYLQSPSLLKSFRPNVLSKKSISKRGIEKKIIKPKSVPNMMSKNHQRSFSRLNQSYISENNIAMPLLKRLHDATAEHLTYPMIAVDLKKTGLVTIGFLISPSGFISEVVLLKSSGFEPLDNAALQAVRSMSPVSNIRQYLNESKSLSIDIVFK